MSYVHWSLIEREVNGMFFSTISSVGSITTYPTEQNRSWTCCDTWIDTGQCRIVLPSWFTAGASRSYCCCSLILTFSYYTSAGCGRTGTMIAIDLLHRWVTNQVRRLTRSSLSLCDPSFSVLAVADGIGLSNSFAYSSISYRVDSNARTLPLFLSSACEHTLISNRDNISSCTKSYYWWWKTAWLGLVTSTLTKQQHVGCTCGNTKKTRPRPLGSRQSHRTMTRGNLLSCRRRRNVGDSEN